MARDHNEYIFPFWYDEVWYSISISVTHIDTLTNHYNNPLISNMWNQYIAIAEDVL